MRRDGRRGKPTRAILTMMIVLSMMMMTIIVVITMPTIALIISSMA
jgi:hypothetical protein